MEEANRIERKEKLQKNTDVQQNEFEDFFVQLLNFE